MCVCVCVLVLKKKKKWRGRGERREREYNGGRPRCMMRVATEEGRRERERAVTAEAKWKRNSSSYTIFYNKSHTACEKNTTTVCRWNKTTCDDGRCCGWCVTHLSNIIIHKTVQI